MRNLIPAVASLLFCTAAMASPMGGTSQVPYPILDNPSDYGSVLNDINKPAVGAPRHPIAYPVPYPVLRNPSDYGSVLNDIDRPGAPFQPWHRGTQYAANSSFQPYPILDNPSDYGDVLNDVGRSVLWRWTG